MFTKNILDLDVNLFDDLSRGITFDIFSDTRYGAILVAPSDDGNSIPIVRTTTSYSNPSHKFERVHYALMENIKKTSGEQNNLYFNNAMVEIYAPGYNKMGFHSDQALDLVDGSHICIFSCYEEPTEPYPRKLVVKDKVSGDTSEYQMDHNSVILFSTLTNQRYTHKIVAGRQRSQSRWLGLTMRFSKTFVYNTGNDCNDYRFTENDEPMMHATDDQRKHFFKLKNMENTLVDFTYPHVSYTLSKCH